MSCRGPRQSPRNSVAGMSWSSHLTHNCPLFRLTSTTVACMLYSPINQYAPAFAGGVVPHPDGGAGIGYCGTIESFMVRPGGLWGGHPWRTDLKKSVG